MDRIVDISQDGRHLRRDRGFLVVEEERNEVGRIALDEIWALIVHAHGVTWSNSLLTSLAQNNCLTVICGNNHFPQALFLPLEGHYKQGARTRAQWKASKPLLKQLWKQIVIAKVKMQTAHLEAHAKDPGRLKGLAGKVRSGDPDNVEAQAARIYWTLLFGKTFRRDRTADGTNALLNYGYTVLRASVARSVVASGLVVSVGLHHHNQYNASALADDLMEPFRPLVDAAVLGLTGSGINEVDATAKRELARLIAVDLDSGETRSPLTTILHKLCHSLALSFENGKADLDLPSPPTGLEWLALGKVDVQE